MPGWLQVYACIRVGTGSFRGSSWHRLGLPCLLVHNTPAQSADPALQQGPRCAWRALMGLRRVSNTSVPVLLLFEDHEHAMSVAFPWSVKGFPGAGDRPIEITLQRAWDALSWPRRFQLAKDLVKVCHSSGRYTYALRTQSFCNIVGYG
jgi:hypothetical protein